ncbi:MAG: PD-(D/E)XK nuclease family protein, partial [Bacteroidales bacterium]|nr:PD-(D/E)XK nuclease family protein [Bacteroidales bacterium]
MSNSSFLKEVARDMYRRFQNDMTNVVMVFPNKRASLFLNQELARISDKPVWAPQYQTISELFLSLSPYTQIDPITCVCKLYDCYCKALNSNETIDDFYGWGEIIMNDLDDIDSQMVDVKQLFKYMEDWNQLSATSDFLSEDQITALKTYFRNFSTDEKEKAKERFIRLWRAMPEIYSSLKETLKKDSLLYKGALYRDVVENHLDRLNVGKTYIFVGFNVLTKVEHKLIDEVNSRATALFYWDYDDRLTADSEGLAHLIYDSGKFIREYLKTMPNAYKPSIDNVQYNVDIQYIKTDSANAQSRYVPQWITQYEDKSDLTKTAVILADESMLPQVLEVLTDDKINITMGYKLSDTPVLSYIIALSDLQLKGIRPSKDTQCAAAPQPLSDGEPVNRYFYYLFYNKTLNHPFTVKDDTLWNKVVAGDDGKSMLDYLDQNVLASFENFNCYSVESEAKADADSSIDQEANPIKPYFALYAEALYRTHLAIEKLRSMNFDFGRKLTCRLLEQVLRSQSVPFHGEPLEGLQVMGVLETRSLDFDNILLLSANDGILPKRVQSNSLVPYCLRHPFGLTTEQEQVNIYAYIFFRLLQRAKHITLMFPISGSDMGQCEMSRFMRQLLAETDFDIKTSHLDFSTKNGFAESQIQKIEKTPEILKAILHSADGKVYEKQSADVGTDTKQKVPRLLSLSSINSYLNCPLQFYFRNVAGMRVKDEISSTIQLNQFGTVFHSAAQIFYTKITNGSPDCRITKELLEQYMKQGLVDLSVDEAFRKEIFDCEGSEVNDYVGDFVIARKVIVEYLQRLVEIDKN